MTKTHATAVDEWLGRTVTAVRDLGPTYVDLSQATAATGSGVADDSGIRGSKVHAPAPIRVEVIDALADIRQFATRYADLARGTLRMGDLELAGTGRRLTFVADVLPRLDAADPNVVDDLAAAVWDISRTARRLLDAPPRRPYRTEAPCPVCGAMSMWVDPQHYRVACGMPGCTVTWGIEKAGPNDRN